MNGEVMKAPGACVCKGCKGPGQYVESQRLWLLKSSEEVAITACPQCHHRDAEG